MFKIYNLPKDQLHEFFVKKEKVNCIKVPEFVSKILYNAQINVKKIQLSL